MGKKSIELIMNKIAVTIVLAIFITAYIPNFFMDVSMQSPNYYIFFFWPAEQMVLYYKNRETKTEIMLKKLCIYLQKYTGAKRKKKNHSILVQQKRRH